MTAGSSTGRLSTAWRVTDYAIAALPLRGRSALIGATTLPRSLRQRAVS